MVLRMAGATWLAWMMRAEREGDDRREDAAWLVYGADAPETAEALERREPAAE